MCEVAYAFARVFLVVEAFISIRPLPTEVYDTLNWTDVIPHLRRAHQRTCPLMYLEGEFLSWLQLAESGSLSIRVTWNTRPGVEILNGQEESADEGATFLLSSVCITDIPGTGPHKFGYDEAFKKVFLI